jgi:hypothetical protein
LPSYQPGMSQINLLNQFALKRMKKITLILFLFILFKSYIYSQSNFVPGYVQITERDTIFGLVDYGSDKSNTISCKFKKTEIDSIQVFKPSCIYGYRYNNNKYYVPRLIQNNGVKKMIFMEYLIEGVVDLYFFRDIKGDHYLIGKTDLPITEISLPKNIVQIDNRGIPKSVCINWTVLKFYLNDCPEIIPEIYQLVSTKHKSLISLLKNYHDIHCPNNVCMIYQKKMPKFRVDIQPVFGLINANTNASRTGIYTLDTYDKKFTLQYGLLSYFWLPIKNERLFFKTGIIFNKVEGNLLYQSKSLTQSSIKIPFQMHYQFFNSNVTPVISGGFNFCLSSAEIIIAPALSLGINTKITNKVYATLSVDFDYWSPFFVIPTNESKLISYSFNFGLAKKF